MGQACLPTKAVPSEPDMSGKASEHLPVPGRFKSRLSSKQKDVIRFMFWSGIDFEKEKLKKGSGKFKDASIFYTTTNQINQTEPKRWLRK